MKVISCTIMGLIVVSEIVIQDEVLDPLLFLAFGLLLGFHGNSELGIRWQIDCTSLMNYELVGGEKVL